MKKKAQRRKLARHLRALGIKGTRSFEVAKAIVRAGHPASISESEAQRLALWISEGGFCEECYKHVPTVVYCEASGASLNEAWSRLWNPA